MARVVMEDGFEDEVMAGWLKLAEERLGPDIAGDARRYAPEDTGALKESVEHHMEGPTLIVSATGGADGRTYAAYVELGHRIVAWGHDTGKVQPPRPYLRPALYTERGD